MTETGLWLYAVTRDPCGAGPLTGVAGAPVVAIAADGLVALASPVPLADFDEVALGRNLEDLDWLAATATAHDTVVSALFAATTTVPLRLATVYRDEPGVREMLTERGPSLRAALELLTGRTEWGVKAFADPDSVVPQPIESTGGSGAAYLKRRRAQLSAREQSHRIAAAHGDRLHETFAALAVAARRHPAQDRALSGRPGWMVLNGAYLVDDTRSAELAATAERLADGVPGVRVELTGPWSPYSFAGTGER